MKPIIVAILCILCILCICQFVNYDRLTNLISINQKNNTSAAVYKFDELYNDNIHRHEAIKHNKSKLDNIPIESDYENIDISMVSDSYNICYIRKFPWSHPTDSTIKMANIKDNLTILDMGAGTGMVAIYICNKFPNITIDCIVNSQNLFNIIKTNIKTYNLSTRIHVYKQDFNNLNNKIRSDKHISDILLNKTYDRILFLESIGYAHNRRELINICYNMLNSGGQLFIKTPSFSKNIPIHIAKNLMNIWNYNSSTLDSLLNDVKSTGSDDIKYNSFKLYNNLLNINHSDVINGIKFCVKNKVNLIRHTHIYLLYINCDFVLITRNEDNSDIIANT